MLKKYIFIVSLFSLVVASAQRAQNRTDRITIGCQDLFLSGINLAWVDFGEDVGVRLRDGSTVHPRMAEFEAQFDSVAAVGGNTIRWWLHTDGSSSPQYDGNNLSKELNPDFIPDVKKILQAAWTRGLRVQICLWSFDMLKYKSNYRNVLANLKVLEDEQGTNAYINNVLIPLVDGLKDEKGLLAYEIFNEPYWMVQQNNTLTDVKTSKYWIQRFTNKCAAAIHDTDPNALVTNGMITFATNSDIQNGDYFRFAEEYSNWNSDAALRSAGGEFEGTLDFYNVHYYLNKGTDVSPFVHNKSRFEIDEKPVVVAEFYADAFGVPDDEVLTTLNTNGYAGGLYYSYTDTWSSQGAKMKAAMQKMYDSHKEDVEIKDVTCEGNIYAAFNLSETTICSNDEVLINNVVQEADNYYWTFGTDATPSIYSGMNPPAVTYSSGGEKEITLSINDGESVKTKTVNVTQSSVSSTTVSLIVDVEGSCDLSTKSVFSAILDPVQNLPFYAEAIPTKTWWDGERPDAASTQTSFIVSSDGQIDGMNNSSQFLLGRWHNWSTSTNEFTGNFQSSVSLKVFIFDLGTGGGNMEVSIKIDGVEEESTTPVAGQVIEVSIPAGQHTVSVSNTGDNWFRVQKYVFENVAEEFEYKWYKEGSLFSTTNTSSIELDAVSGENVYVQTEVDKNVECGSTIIESNTITTSCDNINSIDELGDDQRSLLSSRTLGQYFVAGTEGYYRVIDQTGRTILYEYLKAGDQFGEEFTSGIYILSVDHERLKIMKE